MNTFRAHSAIRFSLSLMVLAATCSCCLRGQEAAVDDDLDRAIDVLGNHEVDERNTARQSPVAATTEPKPNGIFIRDEDAQNGKVDPTEGYEPPCFVHTDFVKAFTDGYVFFASDKKVPVRQVKVGDLVVSSGRICAFDPSWGEGPGPFQKKAPTGTFPVYVCYAKVDEGFERLACALLQFRKTMPTRWEMALWPEQDITDLLPGEIFGYGVDTGTGCFVDADYVEHLKSDDAWGRIIDAGTKDEDELLMYGALVLDPDSRGNVISFETGNGDLTSASYWGFDRNGDIVCLVTDFKVLTDWYPTEVVVPNIGKHLGKSLEREEFEKACLSVRVDAKDKLFVIAQGPSLTRMRVSLVERGMNIPLERFFPVYFRGEEVEKAGFRLDVADLDLNAASLRVWFDTHRAME